MKQKILIVEDDPFIALDLHDTFEDAGFSVLGPVAAVNEGYAILKNHMPDIAMLDYNLGRETSIPLARSLQLRGIPFIFLSGFVEKITTGKTLENFEFIAKPINAEMVVKRVFAKLAARKSLA